MIGSLDERFYQFCNNLHMGQTAVPDFFGGDEARLQDYLKFRDSLTELKNPTRISDVIASGLDQYDAAFVPGGHGPMMDLLDDPDAGHRDETL
jgi:hypothetical protein